MPLKSGKSKEILQENIATEIRRGKDPKQAAAIAYAQQRKDGYDSIMDDVNKAIDLAGKIKHGC